MGFDSPTPYLQAFSGESVVFKNTFAAAPTCSPSRAALLTGQHPHQAGMLGLAHRGFTLGEKDHHIASILKRNGYETALSGIQHDFAAD